MPLNDVGGLGRLKKLGIIRLGWQEPNASGGGQHAVASDHFVMKDAQFLVPFFGEEPKELKIHFPFPRFDDNIEAFYRVWAGSTRRKGGICICQGDGMHVLSALPFKTSVKDDGTVRVNRAPGDRLVSYGKAAHTLEWDDQVFHEGEIVPCPGKKRDLYTHCGACKPSILIKVMVREPIEAVRWGYWQISTKSINNYEHFMGVWNSITDGGRLDIPMNNVPFVLSIAPGSTIFQGKDGMWAPTEKFYLQLELDKRVAELAAGARDRRFIAYLEGRVDPMVPQLSAVVAEDEEPPFGEPPYDYDGELVEGDEFLMRSGDYSGAAPNGDAREDLREEEAEAPQAESVPVPRGLNHRNIVKRAADLPGYEHVGQVKSALRALYGDDWERSSEWSPSDAWVLLQQHAEAG